jgi:addiction module RelE/StbE family toxin
MNIVFHKKFKKAYQKQPAKERKRFMDQLEVFCQDPYDPTLNNHALTGLLKPYRSINITGDIRAWYEVIGDDIVFLKIGSHSELYG